MDWFRCYHGITSDAKWPLIARKSGHPVGVVVSVWMALLDHASQADARGSLEGFDCETVDALYGYEDGTTEAVFAVMEAKGLVSGNRLVAWDKRQPAREDAVGPEAKSAAQRKREQRARDREKSHGESQDVTQCHAESRHVTQCHAPEQNREEKIREEKYTPPLPPSPGGGACALPPAPLSGEDIAEAQDAVRQEHKRGDYEFSLLRDAYDKARQEGPRAGRQEFLSLFHSPEWPGIDELVHAVEALCAEDDQFRRGFAPGLGKFLREGMWRMKPRAPAGEQASSPEDAEGKRKWEELKAKVRADKEARKKRGR